MKRKFSEDDFEKVAFFRKSEQKCAFFNDFSLKTNSNDFETASEKHKLLLCSSNKASCHT